MIVDLPSEADFRRGGIDLLNFAWDSVLTLLRHLQDVEAEGFSSLDEIKGDYWKASARTLSTALALTQQGIEFILKGLICRVSPLLLIATPIRDWPAKVTREDVPFADLKTVDALDLPRLHDALIAPSLPSEFVRMYEDLRRQRNALQHTIDKRLSISAREVLIAIFETWHHLIRPQTWLNMRSTLLEDSPESVAFSPDFVEGLVIREGLIVAALLQRREAVKYLGFDKSKRVYICPDCSVAYGHFTGQRARSAQLSPNSPTSTSVWCFICQTHTFITRRKCENSDCRGNVIYTAENWCLSCGEKQENDAT